MAASWKSQELSQQLQYQSTRSSLAHTQGKQAAERLPREVGLKYKKGAKKQTFLHYLSSPNSGGTVNLARHSHNASQKSAPLRC